MTQLCEAPPSLFKRRHFDREIIILCVRWYLTYKLSYRDLKAMMAERGVDLAHTTIMLWVQRYVPECEKQWQRYARAVGTSWRVDETYSKIKGNWGYLYRGVDKEGRTVDFLLSERRGYRGGQAMLCAGSGKTRGGPAGAFEQKVTG